ncbi:MULTISPECIES: glycosyltransferase [unclassified Cyanobium]|uniref:glycosyltransferase n=1 Tax=unclassified Cyanobium TaxID=2627006 RepID=UPI0020CDA651|nr:MULTISPECIES: glycosyltransferase [unclassified Cyanobium]MCP9835526.1 glycosyltransferase [Cyanobium sp. La Preciosa 7G6]MCP9938292.1 glycosyltransferase [Cyanobium sp. Aljojuca 7A6]
MLSLSMIVRNEAERLERCLHSVAGFVDEVVVVDTGSDDNTAAIAANCGARVHHLAWPGDFAPARNHALDLVRGDWVLVLDADEWLRPEARSPLRALMEQPQVLLINLLRQEVGAAQSPFSSVSRLFRRHPAIRWSRRYHAMVDDSVAALLEQEPHWQVLACGETALGHEGYRPDLLAASGKAERLRQAMEAELAARPGDPYACAKLGALEVSQGQRARGIALLEEGLAQVGARSVAEHYELLLHLAIARSPGEPAAAAALYRQALDLPLEERLTLGARLNLGALLLRQGALEEAAALTADVTRLCPELPLAWFNLGLIERQRGRPLEAITAYRQALALAPEHADAQRNLAAALLLAGDIPGARDGFRRAIALLESQGQPQQASELAQRAGALVRLDA